MAVVNPEKIAEILAECAQAYILPRYKQLEEYEISTKSGPRDLVTQADIDVEAHLERVLPDFLPGSIVIGEEGISRGDVCVEVLKDSTRKIWIVDPVDGTNNFVHGKREFGIMLACIVGGETQYGWIYDVLGTQAAIGEKGSGAYWGSERLAVRHVDGAHAMRGHVNPRYFPKMYHEHIRKASEQFERCESLHCAAHEYLRIAKGEADFSVYSKLKPWDHIPGALIVQEAGGYAALWDGRAYQPAEYDCGLIVSTSQDHWQLTHDIILNI